MIDRMIHLDDYKKSFIAMTSCMCIHNSDLFVTYTLQEDILMGYSLMNFLASCINGRYIVAG